MNQSAIFSAARDALDGGTSQTSPSIQLILADFDEQL
jgi:hypothetical protein